MPKPKFVNVTTLTLFDWSPSSTLVSTAYSHPALWSVTELMLLVLLVLWLMDSKSLPRIFPSLISPVWLLMLYSDTVFSDALKILRIPMLSLPPSTWLLHFINRSLCGGAVYADGADAYAAEVVSKTGVIVVAANYGLPAGIMTSGALAISRRSAFGVTSFDNSAVMQPFLTVDDARFPFGLAQANSRFNFDTAYEIIANNINADENDVNDDGLVGPFPDATGKALLIRWGNIGRSVGCRNAFAAGAAACIIYSNSTSIPGILGFESLPSLSTSNEAGKALIATLKAGKSPKFVVGTQPTAGTVSDTLVTPSAIKFTKQSYILNVQNLHIKEAKYTLRTIGAAMATGGGMHIQISNWYCKDNVDREKKKKGKKRKTKAGIRKEAMKLHYRSTRWVSSTVFNSTSEEMTLISVATLHLVNTPKSRPSLPVPSPQDWHGEIVTNAITVTKGNTFKLPPGSYQLKFSGLKHWGHVGAKGDKYYDVVTSAVFRIANTSFGLLMPLILYVGVWCGC
ncbi:hypothetical protein BC829DRAFT_422786 [Chytridium lagenaria]|nr:hypothetical protein BC829DRAFT_422786 [Chytridium lagenaria]